jgi:acyl-CoA thioesterase FadM
MTLIELNRRVFKTLMDNLGYVNVVRFFKQFDTGRGDYSQERHQWLDDLSMDEIWTDLQKRQAE